jgi:hypothetical protein
MTTLYKKIYIKNINLNNIDSKFFEKINKYFLHDKHESRLFSKDGIFIIKNGKIFKQTIIDKPLIPLLFNNYELLIDESIIEENIILSQIPFDCFQEDIIIKYYAEKSNNNIKLVIEFNKNNMNIVNLYISTFSKIELSYVDFNLFFKNSFNSFFIED